MVGCWVSVSLMEIERPSCSSVHGVQEVFPERKVDFI